MADSTESPDLYIRQEIRLLTGQAERFGRCMLPTEEGSESPESAALRKLGVSMFISGVMGFVSRVVAVTAPEAVEIQAHLSDLRATTQTWAREKAPDDDYA